jgi:hypothetical protein
MCPHTIDDNWNRVRQRRVKYFMSHYALNITLAAICGAYILAALALWASEEL